ncbi:MAG: carbohydrate ABC transporter permease [Lachnospiraceae bacterium]|nr:carbohydrate ABC transporter permease [Lachnospiraceae bacterium]
MSKSNARKMKWSEFRERNKKSGGYLLKKKTMDVGVSLARFILLFGMCFMILQPILEKISVSLMSLDDVYNPVVISIPTKFITENYKIAYGGMRYATGIKNTLVVSITIAIVQVAMCTLVGYGFARFEFPFKKFWFGCVMAMILITPQTISTSLYLHFRFFDVFGLKQLITGEPWNLRNSTLPYYLMSLGCTGLKNGLYIFLIRQFFRNVPGDLEEAAYVDGLGTFKTFIRIMLPEAKPIITSCFLFSFVWQWTDVFYTRMFLGGKVFLSTSLSGFADGIGAYVGTSSGNGGPVALAPAYVNQLLSTAILLVIAPLIILYLFAQRAFVESISSTGIKM